MSRSGYSDNLDSTQLNVWRGAVESAIRGKRGQAFLREMRDTLDAMEQKRLVYGELEKDGEVCAIGSVAKRRGVDMSKLDPEDRDAVGHTFNIAPALAAEIVYMNDEGNGYGTETPEERYARVRAWIDLQIPKDEP